MFKFIIFCAVVAICVARSLNDDKTPLAVADENDAVEVDQPEYTMEDEEDESDWAAVFNSNSDITNDSIKTRGFFAWFSKTTTTTTTAATVTTASTTAVTTTTTTPLPMSVESLLAKIESIEDELDIGEGADKLKWGFFSNLFTSTTTTTTSTTTAATTTTTTAATTASPQLITLLLNINTAALAAAGASGSIVTSN